MTSEKLDKALGWASLLAKLIGFLQAVIPAFLVAWIEALRSKEVALKNQLDYERSQGKTKDQKRELEKSFEDKKDIDIIDDFLADELDLPNTDSSRK